jgi:hypothetical protein
LRERERARKQKRAKLNFLVLTLRFAFVRLTLCFIFLLLFYQFEYQHDEYFWSVTAGILSCIAWMVFCIPLIQVAWIQSQRGTVLLTTHIAIGTLAIGASLIELMSRLLFIGSSASTNWLANKFNLDNWVDLDVTDGTDGDIVAAPTESGTKEPGDMIGWRVLQMIGIVTRAMHHWIDAAEWLFLAAIFTLIYISVYKSEHMLFPRNWARFGMGMGVLSFANFASDVLRLHVWMTPPFFVTMTTAVTRFVLMPVWLVWLSLLLPGARMNSVTTTTTTSSPKFGPDVGDDVDAESPSFS